MTPRSQNPFPEDADRHAIWEILMRRDFVAFLAADWSLTAPDFCAEEFYGLDGEKQPNPDRWRLKFSDLASYREEWLKQAVEFQQTQFKETALLDAFFEICTMRDIEISGSRAVAHKKFDGQLEPVTGELVRLLWQTLYFLKKTSAGWKVTGFVGYLPNPLPAA